jgi:iron complex outermembrane receptor protein
LTGLGGIGIPLLALISMPVGAQQGQSASARAMLEEVVVTARRREESLQDLPLSIQAITSDAMQAQGIYNIESVEDFVPNLVLNDDQRANDTRMFVRGIGGGFSNPDQVFGVGMYIDGHYLSGSLGAFMSTVDIERVEVLRGPQGTLFGKNTTGGAISLISAKPGPEFDSYVTLRAGEFGQQDVRAMVNTPITDTLFFRGNVASEETDGYYFNRFDGQDTGGTDQTSLGLALRWEPSDSWTIDTRLSMAEDRDEQQGAQCRAYPDEEMYYAILNNPANDPDADPSTWTAEPFAGPDLTLGTADDVIYEGPGPFEFGEGAWGGADIGDLRIDAIYPGANAAYLNSCNTDFTSGDVWQTYQDFNLRSDVDNDMFTVDATWDAPGAVGPFETATVQIKGGWRYSSYRYSTDRDYGPGAIDHAGNLPNTGDSRGIARWTDEFEVIFNGDLTDQLNITAGMYWFDDHAETGNGTCTNAWIDAYDAATDTINGLPDDDIECIPEGGTLFHRLPDTSFDGQSSNWGIADTLSTALYAHAVYSFNEQWDLAVGARYMEDERTQQAVEIPAVPGSCTTDVNGPLELCTAQFIMNRDTVLNEGFFVDSSATFDDVTPTISLTRHLTPGDTLESGMIYGTISQGYLTGAFNSELNPFRDDFTPEQSAAVAAIVPYGPESVTNYEVGFKGTLFDGALRLAAAVFVMDYEDKQEAIEVDNADERFGPDTNLEYVQNAADARISGLELELRSSPWDGGFVSLDIGMLESEYSNFLIVDLDDPLGPMTDVSNRRLANQTPEWTLTASVEHAFQLANGATLTPQLGVYAQDEMEWLPGLDRDEVSPMCHQDSFAKWRARVTYEPAAANWQAAVFGYNITDEEILYRCQGIRSGSVGAWYSPPSQWGAEFTMRFGAGGA